MFKRLYSSLEIKKAIECYDRVKSYRTASHITGISKSTIHRWYKSFHSLMIRQSVQKRKNKRKSRKPKYPDLIDELKQLFHSKQLKYYTLKSIQSQLSLSLSPSLSWIRKCLSKSNISRRRFVTSKVSTPNLLRLSELTQTFSNTFSVLQNNEIVCIDETGFSNIGNHTYGYFIKGKQPEQAIVSKRQKQSLVMAISSEKVISFHHQEKPYNSESFFNYVESLLPLLPSNTKAILIDNVSFHKTRKLRELIESKGLKLLFIPPYSPRCNPIEEVFSLLKHHYRSLNIQEPILYNISKSLEHLNRIDTFDNFYNHTRRYLQTVSSA